MSTFVTSSENKFSLAAASTHGEMGDKRGNAEDASVNPATLGLFRSIDLERWYRKLSLLTRYLLYGYKEKAGLLHVGNSYFACLRGLTFAPLLF